MQPLRAARIVLATVLVLVCVAGAALRFVYIEADFPPEMIGASDEGNYARNAVRFVTNGDWHAPSDYNTAVNYPVFTFIQVIAFSLFGPTLVVARSIDIVLSLLLSGLSAALAARFRGGWAGLVVLTLMLSNAMFFCHSRMAHLDTPMSLFVLISLALLLWREDPAWWRSALSAAFLCLAGLTKTNAVFAVPLVLLVILLRHTTWKRRLISIGVYAVVGAIFVATYVFLLFLPYYDDYARIAYAAVGRRVSLDPATVIGGIRNMLSGAAHVAPWLSWSGLLLGVPLLMCRLQSPQRLLSFVLVGWVALYLCLMGLGSHVPTRYFIPIIAPLAMLAGLSVDAALRCRPTRILGVVASLGLGAVITINAVEVGRYLNTAQFTFAEAARDIGKRIRADGCEQPLMLGTSGGIIGLVNGLPSVGTHFGLRRAHYEDFNLSLYEPTHLIARGGITRTQQELVSAQNYRVIEMAHYDVKNSFASPTDMVLYRLVKRKTEPLRPEKSKPKKPKREKPGRASSKRHEQP